LLAFAACTPENGLDDFGDPIFASDTTVEFPDKAGSGTKESRTKDVFSSALAVYGPFLEGTAFGASEAAAWRC
jgi:hypothetical protein